MQGDFKEITQFFLTNMYIKYNKLYFLVNNLN